MRLSLQDMIDQVIDEASTDGMAKLAEEAKDKKMSKDEAERKAAKEEAQQGGGSPDSYEDQEKQACSSEYVQKLAAAVQEIVDDSGMVVTAAADEAAKNVGPGKGPGASDTNLESPVSGEQSDVSGEAKTKIPMKTPLESKGSGGNEKNPDNAMATNAEMMHGPQGEVLKQASNPLEAVILGAMDKEGGTVSQGLKWIGRKAPGAGKEEIKALSTKAKNLKGAAETSGALGAGGQAARAEQQVGAATEAAHAAAKARGKSIAKKVGIGAAATTAAGTGVAVPLALRKRNKEKKAEDAINPATISASKTSALPEDKPSSMKRPAEVTSQEKMVGSNEAATSTKKVQTAAVPKKRMKEVLGEPAQTSATDKVLDEALGSDKVNQAGAKIAAVQARAALSKIASEGCKCQPGEEACYFHKLAAVARRRANEGSEKRSQMAAPQGAGNAVPSTVTPSASPSGSMAGGTPAPQM